MTKLGSILLLLAFSMRAENPLSDALGAGHFAQALQIAESMLKTQPNDRAAGYLARLLRLDPGDQTAHGMAGALAFEAADCALAISHFQRAKSECERNELASSQFGQCLIQLGRPGEAAA